MSFENNETQGTQGSAWNNSSNITQTRDALVARVKEVLTSPNEAWNKIASEQTTAKDVIKGYVIPLAGLGAIAAFIGTAFVGIQIPMIGTYRAPIGSALVSQVIHFALSVVMVYVLAFICEKAASMFGGSASQANTVKLVAYSQTPAFVVGLLMVWPSIGALFSLLGIYGLYIFYIGITRMTGVPSAKRLPFVGIVLVGGIISGIIIATVAGIVTPKPPLATEMQKNIEDSMKEFQKNFPQP